MELCRLICKTVAERIKCSCFTKKLASHHYIMHKVLKYKEKLESFRHVTSWLLWKPTSYRSHSEGFQKPLENREFKERVSTLRIDRQTQFAGEFCFKSRLHLLQNLHIPQIYHSIMTVNLFYWVANIEQLVKRQKLAAGKSTCQRTTGQKRIFVIPWNNLRRDAITKAYLVMMQAIGMSSTRFPEPYNAGPERHMKHFAQAQSL